VHPLLRGFLLAKLRELDDEKIQATVEGAVGYLAEQHRWDDCLFVLEQFPDDRLILETLKSGLEEILDSGRIVTVSSWLKLAEKRCLRDPVFLLAEAEVALRSRQDLKADALGEQAAALLKGELAARAYLVAARAAHLSSDPDKVSQLCDLALKSASGIETRFEALWLEFSSALERPGADLNASIERLSGVRRGNTAYALRLRTARGAVLGHDRDIRGAVAELKLADPLMGGVTDPFARTNFLQFLAYSLTLAASYEEAITAADRLIDEAHRTGLEFVFDYALLRKAGALIGLRRLGDAQRVITELQRRSASASELVADNTVLHRIKLLIAAGDLPRAATLLDRDFGATLRPAFRGELAAYRGIVAVSIGDTRGAIDALEQDESSFEFGEAAALRDVARAIISLASSGGDIDIESLIDRLFAFGQLDALVTGYRAFPLLAQEAVSFPGLRRPLTRLLVQANDTDIARSIGLRVPRELRSRQPLSPREQQVYDLLIQGRPNREIAKALFISESTTKVHVRHIFEKLGVHTRAEAARLAGTIDAA
jgi:DNA-binding CsgD family transcriptional regulator